MGLPERVVVVGQGYVGLPLAVRAAEVGHTVIGYDVDEWKVKLLASGESHVEDVPASRLARTLASGHYRPTHDETELADFDVAVIAVPTPLRHGTPDLSYVESAAGLLGRYLGAGSTVVLESTTYPGTTAELVGPILGEVSGLVPGRDFHLGYSPERIDPGNPVWTLENTPKLVSGIDQDSLARVRSFYATIVDSVVDVSRCEEAELAKLLENTFRHVNIGLVNELAVFAHELGIDVWEAIDAAATKPFGFLRFTPGPGVGGHCLPIDPSYLSWRVERTLGKRFQFVELANAINNAMPAYVVQRLMQGLNARSRPIKEARVLLLGLAYKRNTADARESPAVEIVTRLRRLGAHVRAADPHVASDIRADLQPFGDTVRVEATPEELSRADAVVILADHDEFDFDAVVTHARYVLDCRRRVRAGHVETL